MSYCVITGCTNRINSKRKNWEQLEKEKSSKFSFHLFPKDADRRNKWLEAINLKNWHPNKTAAICSVHFKEEDYESNSILKRLKKDAIPHLLHEVVKRTNNVKNESIAQNLENVEVDIDNKETLVSLNENTDSDVRSIAVQSTPIMKHQSTCMSPERIFNSPSKIRLRENHMKEMQLLRRKLYDVTYSEKKAKEKLCTFKNALKELQKRNLIEQVNLVF